MSTFEKLMMTGRYRTIFCVFTVGLLSISVCESKRVSSCKCNANQFDCSDGSRTKCSCILLSWKCDGEIDCVNASDERDCVSVPCPSHWFRCSTGKCIKPEWQCDGFDDCGDDEDEQKCGKETCDEETQRECGSGECVPNRWWCDGSADCSDNSDEKSCELRNCTENEFLCNTGECVPLRMRCDYDFDCKDGSEEEHCEEPSTQEIDGFAECKGDQFDCGISGECIPADYRCDGVNDCGSKLDEESCPNLRSPCTASQFTCDNQQCISLNKHCDGTDDCGDGSDENEADCTYEECIEGEMRCNNGQCISKRWRCDGRPECEDGSDELGCELNHACSFDQFECHRSKRCILSSWRCDGQPDCDDSSDELYCECDPGQYQCHSGECIALGRLCNGIPDCKDMSDEKPVIPCNDSNVLGLNESSCAAENGGCEHACKKTRRGQLMCVCPTGYKLASDMRSCVDIDECKIEGSCSQLCNNTVGSFVCSCLPGYQLRLGGRTCKAMGPAAALLFTNRIDIRRMNPDRSELHPILGNLENAIGLDYHIERGYMFWSDVTLDKIMRSNMNGSDVKEVISSGLESPGGVAVDWIHDLLYWTDSRTSRIEVSELDGRHRKVVVWEKLQKPRALALHPAKGLMFWTDWGRKPCLESAAMDGSMRRAVASSDVFWPNGITIDYTSNRIYWSDAKYHIIETANLDGENRRAVVSSGVLHPFGVTIFEDKVYWTDWQSKSVNSANKFTGGGVTTIRSRLHFPMDIRTYHPLRQPPGDNKCLHASCTHLCLPKPAGFTCACPTGFSLVNETSCAEDIEEFLVFTRRNDIRRISFDAMERADIVLPLEGLKNAVALDWHSGQPGYIFWSDIGLDTINRCNWDGSEQKVLLSTSLDSPAGIAIDWITNKMYWTDSGINRIEVALLDGAMRSVLVWTGLDRPRAIIVYPKTGHMFWTDWGHPAKIERAGMDGSDRMTIVMTNLTWPNGIAIDGVTERIYWTDAGTHKIESCDIDGGKRRTIVSNLPHPFGITLDSAKVYWTDWTTQSIASADKVTGGNVGVIRKDLSYMMDVRFYHKNRLQTPNPCSLANGGCSHLCLLAPNTGNTLNSDLHTTPYSCACPTGLVLGPDKRKCNATMKKFLVLARQLDIRVISLDVPYSADVKVDVDAYMTNVVDVAVDPVEGHLYWSDIGSKKISRSSLPDDPGREQVIVDTGLDTVDGLAVDINGRLIYWTDDGQDTISVASLDGKVRRVLISKGLDSPRAIALHYKLGYMYWTDWGSNPTAKIERAGLDGSNRSVVVWSGLTWPNGLTIDLERGWVIWGDAQNEKIERSDLYGRDRVIILSNVHHPYGLTNLDGQLYWTDWQTRNVESLAMHNVSSRPITMRENMPSMMGIKAVDMEATSDNVCGNNNGGCSHLCLRSPTARLGYVCACPTGVRLQRDGQTCSDLPDEYLLFTSRRMIQRLSLEADESVAVELPIKGLENTIALDYHYKQQFLFFTDVYLDVIKRSNLDGSDARTIVSGDLKAMDGLSVDWVADNFYWTDAGLNQISVARLDGSNRKLIVSEHLDEPRAICVSPSSGLLFWTDWGAKPKIERSFLDGTNRKVLIRKNLQWPNGLTIDYASSRIFWIDAHHVLNRIESCDFTGKRRKIITSPVPHGFAITFLYDTLYWTDWETKNIHSATLPLGRNKRNVVLRGDEELMGIKAVSSSRQSGTNLCDSTLGYGGCQYLCLMRGPYKHVCATPDVVATTQSINVTIANNNTSRSWRNAPQDVTTTQVMTSRTFSEVTSATMQNSTKLFPKAWPYSIAVGIVSFISVCLIALALYLVRRHCLGKRNHSGTPAVSFFNLTFKRNSNSTLAGARSSQATPSPSFRTFGEEEKVLLIPSVTAPVVNRTENGKVDPDGADTTTTSLVGSLPIEENPLGTTASLTSENTKSDSDNHEYESIKECRVAANNDDASEPTNAGSGIAVTVSEKDLPETDLRKSEIETDVYDTTQTLPVC